MLIRPVTLGESAAGLVNDFSPESLVDEKHLPDWKSFSVKTDITCLKKKICGHLI